MVDECNPSLLRWGGVGWGGWEVGEVEGVLVGAERRGGTGVPPSPLRSVIPWT